MDQVFFISVSCRVYKGHKDLYFCGKDNSESGCIDNTNFEIRPKLTCVNNVYTVSQFSLFCFVSG